MTVTESKVQKGRKVKVAEFTGTAPEGMVFSHWATEPNGAGAPIKPGQMLTITQDTRLYAIYKDKPEGTE